MSRLMKRNEKFIKLLTKLPPKERAKVLENAPRELIFALSEGALNVLKGNVPLSKKKYAVLKKYKKPLRELASRKTAVKRKKIWCSEEGSCPHWRLPLFLQSLI